MAQPAGRLRIGTRGSLLARVQTEWVATQLSGFYPDLQIETLIIQTTGDLQRDIPFAQIGTKGMFVKEIEQALLAEHIDLGVHSLKDMPSELPGSLELTCVPPREDPFDALLSRDSLLLEELPHGAVVGTSSLRRQAQLRHLRPDFVVRELRGNLDTRLRKLDEGQYDAVVLACAGLNRLGLAKRITQRLDPSICVPAVGQGALALEIRSKDWQTRSLLQALHDVDSADAVEAERGFLTGLNAGCTLPAGAFATLSGASIALQAVIASPDGSSLLRETVTGSRGAAKTLGLELAATLLARGGREILKGL